MSARMSYSKLRPEMQRADWWFPEGREEGEGGGEMGEGGQKVPTSSYKMNES